MSDEHVDDNMREQRSTSFVVRRSPPLSCGQAGNDFICSRERERGHANDMLMLAARGINGGTPAVGRSEEEGRTRTARKRR